ncbi:hypothetical protein [Miniimonas arenae]|uniref:hypothetical protein n=1 Tax=Miniimonas arenae TaxID=676201 RepID=UPI0028AF38B6|nr:hypothetical protein [Miniimonas arenae]
MPDARGEGTDDGELAVGHARSPRAKGAPATGRPPTDPLESERWSPVRRDLRRRDSGALRTMLGREIDDLVDADGGSVVNQVLRLWARFSQAVYDEDVDVISAELEIAPPEGGDPVDWDTVVAHVFDRVVGLLPAADTARGARCRATFAVFVYCETVVFWEYSVVAAEVRAMRRGLEVVAAAMPVDPASGPDELLCRDVVGFAVDLLRAVERQLDVEQAMAACAVSAVERTAAAARTALERATEQATALRARVAAAGAAVSTDDTAPTATPAAPLAPHLDALLALVLDDLTGTVPYFALLADEIAPASEVFLANLVTRTDDAAVADRLTRAAEACQAFEESGVGQWSVFATEVRAHRVPLEAAAAHCARPDLETLELASADVAYLYPFGLPVAGSATDVRRELMAALQEAGGGGSSPIETLAGVPVVIDDAPRSDGWLASTWVQDRDYRAFRVVFPDHELVLQTADGVTIVGLDVDLRLSGMGNHYVRIRVGTDTRVEGAEHRRWNAHDLEQAVRRGGQFAGAEQVRFRARTPGVHDSEEFDTLLDLATRIVGDVARSAHRLVGSPPADLDRDLGIVEGFLARYCQVLVMVGRAEAVAAGGRRRALVDVAALDGVLGVTTALTAQRALAQSALEWVTYESPSPEVRARRTLAGRIRRELIWCAGDLTAVFGPTAPHWQVLETEALAEFASSLIGVFWRRQQWLRSVVDDAGRYLAGNDAAGATHAAVADLEDAERRLGEAIRHVQLLVDRANEHVLSKDQQGREVCYHLIGLNGVAELQRSLGATVQAALSTQRFLQERLDAEHRHERALAEEEGRAAEAEQAERAEKSRQRPLEVLLAVLAVVGLIDLFGWVNDAVGIVGLSLWWVAETVAIVAVAGLLLWLGMRAWRVSDGERERRRRVRSVQRERGDLAPPGER